MTNPTHHIHKRKRIHQKHEEYPHPNKWKRFLDDVVYLTGMLIAIMTIPQAYKIWSTKDAAGVSILTWVTYFLAAIILAIYGVVHKEQPIVLTDVSQAIVEIVIIVGIIMF
jgi:uncharacterized protein with PQ loop repeat